MLNSTEDYIDKAKYLLHELYRSGSQRYIDQVLNNYLDNLGIAVDNAERTGDPTDIRDFYKKSFGVDVPELNTFFANELSPKADRDSIREENTSDLYDILNEGEKDPLKGTTASRNIPVHEIIGNLPIEKTDRGKLISARKALNALYNTDAYKYASGLRSELSRGMTSLGDDRVSDLAKAIVEVVSDPNNKDLAQYSIKPQYLLPLASLASKYDKLNPEDIYAQLMSKAAEGPNSLPDKYLRDILKELTKVDYTKTDNSHDHDLFSPVEKYDNRFAPLSRFKDSYVGRYNGDGSRGHKGTTFFILPPDENGDIKVYFGDKTNIDNKSSLPSKKGDIGEDSGKQKFMRTLLGDLGGDKGNKPPKGGYNLSELFSPITETGGNRALIIPRNEYDPNDTFASNVEKRIVPYYLANLFGDYAGDFAKHPNLNIKNYYQRLKASQRYLRYADELLGHSIYDYIDKHPYTSLHDLIADIKAFGGAIDNTYGIVYPRKFKEGADVPDVIKQLGEKYNKEGLMQQFAKMHGLLNDGEKATDLTPDSFMQRLREKGMGDEYAGHINKIREDLAKEYNENDAAAPVTWDSISKFLKEAEEAKKQEIKDRNEMFVNLGGKNLGATKAGDSIEIRDGKEYRVRYSQEGKKKEKDPDKQQEKHEENSKKDVNKNRVARFKQYANEINLTDEEKALYNEAVKNVDIILEDNPNLRPDLFNKLVAAELENVGHNALKLWTESDNTGNTLDDARKNRSKIGINTKKVAESVDKQQGRSKEPDNYVPKGVDQTLNIDDSGRKPQKADASFKFTVEADPNYKEKDTGPNPKLFTKPEKSDNITEVKGEEPVQGKGGKKKVTGRQDQNYKDKVKGKDSVNVGNIAETLKGARLS